MKIFFIDDSVQKKPTRSKCGTLVAVGGVVVPEDNIAPLEQALDGICKQYGFPDGEPFKWSPGREHWMRDHLKDAQRAQFFLDAIAATQAANARAVFICDDKKCSTAVPKSTTHELDVATMLIERVNWHFLKSQSKGLIVVDRQTGDRKDEEKFLAACLDTLRAGTKYVKPSTIIMTVLSCPSRLCRLLQIADVVTSATLARVSGESVYSPPIVTALRPLYLAEANRIGGVGVKLHPFKKYGNLYHWIFGDQYYVKGNMGYQMPLAGHAFAKNENDY